MHGQGRIHDARRGVEAAARSNNAGCGSSSIASGNSRRRLSTKSLTSLRDAALVRGGYSSGAARGSMECGLRHETETGECARRRRADHRRHGAMAQHRRVRASAQPAGRLEEIAAAGAEDETGLRRHDQLGARCGRSRRRDRHQDRTTSLPPVAVGSAQGAGAWQRPASASGSRP